MPTSSDDEYTADTDVGTGRQDRQLFGSTLVAGISGGLIALSAALLVWALPGDRAFGVVGKAGDAPATPTDLTHGIGSNSPSMRVDPTDRHFVVLAHRVDATEIFSCGLQLSGDGGRNWVPANPVAELPPGVDRCYAPDVAFGPDGTLFYLFVGLAGAGNRPTGAYLVTSSDSARSFSKPHEVLGRENYSVRMAIGSSGHAGSGRLHLVWLHAAVEPGFGGFVGTENPIMSMFSDDAGVSFSTPVQLSAPGRRAVAPALTVGPGGQVIVAYIDLNDDARDYQGLEGPTWDGRWSLVVVSSGERGVRFDHQVVVDGGIVPSMRVMLVFTMPPPSLAMNGQRTCAAWTDARYGDDDVLLNCTDYRAARWWSKPKRVNDDAMGDGKSQYLPAVDISPNGRIDVLYFDRRGDDQNRMAVPVLSSSWNGQTFSPAVPISHFPVDSRIGAQYANVSAQGLVEFGSRLGLISTRTGAITAWPDTRNARDVYDAVGQDIYTSTLTVSEPAHRTAWIALALVGLVSGIGTWLTRRRLWWKPSSSSDAR